MFTGLVQDIGTVKQIHKSDSDMRIEIDTKMPLNEVKIGSSVSCAGCCLTVVEKTNSSLFFDVSSETLNRTTIGSWRVMTHVNLEPSLKVGDEVGGHFVSGHVDSMTKIIDIQGDAGSRRLTIAIPKGYEKYIVPKGSITLDGVSLTVNEVHDQSFGVNIIPHTWENTTLQNLNGGDELNIEIDMLARYVAKMMKGLG